MVSVAKWNIIWKWNTIDYENENAWKISIIYEKLNGIFLCKLIYDGFFNKINS